MCCVRLERCRSTAGVAAEVAAEVLPEGCWAFTAVELGVRRLVKRSYWGLICCCRMSCALRIYCILSWLGLGAAGAAGVVLLLGTGVLLSNEAAGAAVKNLVAL